MLQRYYVNTGSNFALEEISDNPKTFLHLIILISIGLGSKRGAAHNFG